MEKIGIVLILIQIISKIFGFAREMVLSYFYGTSTISDAYLVAFTIPSILFSLIGAGITAGYIPTYTKIRKIDGNDKAELFTSNLTNIILLFTLGLAVIISIFPGLFVKLIASGFQGEQLELAVYFTRISIWSIVFLGATTILIPYLNIKDSFYVSSAIGIPLNIGLISGIILSYYFSKFYLAFGITLGYLLQIILLIPVLKRNEYTHRFFIDFKDRYIKDIMLLATPLVVGSCASQLNVIIDRTIASFLPTGSISALNYSNRLNGFIQGVLLAPLITLLYPKISEFAVNNDHKKLARYFYEAISIMTLMVLPLMIGGMYLSKEITGVLFLRGAFDESALAITSSAVLFYLIGIIGIAYREVQFRVYYSYGDTKTPVKNSIIAVFINIVLNLILSRFMGASGLALATSISSIVAAILLQRNIKQYINDNEIKENCIRNVSKIFISGILMLMMLILFRNIYPPRINILNLMIQAIIGALTYLVVLKILRVDELKVIEEMIINKIKK
ncbi:murein biosynthesis integral membrane protein MurJ [Finegoldia magna]|uniref:murein biosynthesis integral membrane protein MurJ n=1 Tax=Finegoldia magna TaxID=1260 RepID=UPI00290CEFC4|nr:murein biosynthesis integral membrane protein MurJ [Finegoldia magna]MDU6552960.1 murein biosynthesis integral membrane protein MurJ [Finegoldia magna]